MVLVMWLVAAMSIMVGGALALAREEISLASRDWERRRRMRWVRVSRDLP